MQYTVRAFIEGKDERLNEICRVFSSMERAAYNLLRDGERATTTKRVLRDRYGMKNARWLQSAMNQGRAVMESQEEGIMYRVDLYEEKVRNTREKMERLHNPLKILGCKAKIQRLQGKVRGLKGQLNDKSYPRAVFGSRNLLRKLSIARGRRREGVKKEWREARSNHFFSVGQANQRGNANTRLSYDEEGFYLEVRNWYSDDFRVRLEVPEHTEEKPGIWKAIGILKGTIDRATSLKLGRRDEEIVGGLAYSVRIIRSAKGYQVFVSFEVQEPAVEWNAKMAGIDINPEGIACTIVTKDGNFIATRFFRDNRLISASKNKRKWVLENLVNRMLRWCLLTHNCNAVAIEKLGLKGAYDYDSKTNFKLSNFMRRKMLEVVRLHALKMRMLCVEVNPAYSSMVAKAKYGKQFGGFNMHQLAAFVIGRRALGYGETPLPKNLRETQKERRMWNHCASYYGYQPQVQTLPRREPMEWKSGGDGNGGGLMTELLRARPTITPAMRLGHDAPANSRTGAMCIIAPSRRRVGSVHPNRHTIGGDGARGHRVNPPDVRIHQSAVVFNVSEDNAIR